MTSWQALWLGVIQGLTEFLPVSSSTHLVLARRLLNLPSDLVYFDLICHIGTLVAIVGALQEEIRSLFKTRHQLFSVIFALIPLIPGYFLFKPLRSSFVEHNGLFLLFTGIFLFGATLIRPSQNNSFHLKREHMIWIGIAQVFALFPGMSRSGSTICAARFLRWEWKQAIAFSFLLAIPTIAGGALIESCIQGSGSSSCSLGLRHYLFGFLASMVVGFYTIRILFWNLSSLFFRALAVYCTALGALLAWGGV